MEKENKEAEAANLSLSINEKSEIHAAISISIGAMFLVGVEKLDPDHIHIKRLFELAKQLRDEIDQLNDQLSIIIIEFSNN